MTPGPDAESNDSRVFWADVIRPAAEAFAAEDPSRAVRRVRTGALVVAVLVLLAPTHGPLGTGTELLAHTVAGAWFLVGGVAWLLAARAAVNRADWIVSALAVGAGIVVEWAGGGAWWGMALAAAATASLFTPRLRRGVLKLPRARREHDPLPPNLGGVPKLLRSIAATVLIVLILHHFAVEAMYVPTGSMQPTIMGETRSAGGDRLLVNKNAYRFSDARRYDIAVFQYPLYRRINFVKRVLGLPGEEIEIRGGDVWADGVLTRKPALVQESLWREVFPRANPLAKPQKLPGPWSLSENDGWRRDGEGLKLEPRGERPAFVRFSKRGKTNDQRLTLSVTADPDATVVLEIVSRGQLVTWTLPPQGMGTFELDGGESVPVDATLRPGARLQIAAWDGVATAAIDGFTLATIDLDPGRRTSKRPDLAFGGSSALIRFADIRVERDIEYHAKRAKFTVPADGYVMLGDEVTNSMDSRSWTVTEFKSRDGSESWRAAEMVPDETGKMVRNVVRKDGRVRFTDPDGVSHDLAEADLGRPRAVPIPFARKEHLLGRAFLIYWPWQMSGAGFRPQLLP